MKIVVLDGYTLNPGDMSWDEIGKLGELTVYDRTPQEEIIGRARGAEIVLTNKTPLTAATIAELPELLYVGVLATGYNIVDIEAAAKRGIIVTNVPDYSNGSVAQLVFAFLLAQASQVSAHSEAARGGRWAAGPDFSFSLNPLHELSGQTLGLVGFGSIGQQVARIALAFGMRVIVHTRTVKSIPGLEAVRFVSLEALFREADAVSLHCPLTPDTQGLINAHTLAKMKRGAMLINTARGGHVVEQDLAEALQAGTIAAAGLDVLGTEPPSADNPLLSAANCWITPHIGWATVEARRRLLGIAAGNLRAFLQGGTVNQVN
ncbi:D-2-hydroxyacid dehydrogenase [Paenibacillus sacheonensis]|uniref:D-2-hydroxyacid dehydrogenase n=1 Tax=Paenibacillus sacheonensis TaxID=742054 RepID=A0A7X4YMH9_9BACL|nr:D-2-hydroxyacid dehydrogenase [Paenibacillus sacheonensis]MBM7564556.1 glycerate dehydrogenase [Paenibacillus sacheonensis]NBC69113.1 D-2-hydroxyacid dehydrogenase [Paenibacillus sacheonensis]